MDKNNEIRCACQDVINLACDIINSNGLSNIIALLTLVVGIIAIWVGYNKINEYRQEAIFGFHINLFVFIRRLKVYFIKKKQLTEKKDLENANNIFSLLSSNGDIKKQFYSAYESQGEELRDLSLEFLQYLSNAQKQVPPRGCKDRKKWYNDITELVKILNRFSRIGKEKFYADYYEPMDVLKANNKFVKLLSTIEDILEKEKEIY